MRRDEGVRALLERITDEPVIANLGPATADLYAAGDRDANLYTFGAMGLVSSIGLGAALAAPDRKVYVTDGDGSLLMNLGSLVTVGGMAPANLYHIVLDNGIYAMTGGQPVPNADGLDYQGLAESAGYAKTYLFDNLEDWVTGIGEALEEKGPVLIVMKTAPELTDWRNDPPPPGRRMPEAAPVARAALADS